MPTPSNNQLTKPSEPLYPKLSAGGKARFLHDFVQGAMTGAVKKPRFKLASIDEGRKPAGR